MSTVEEIQASIKLLPAEDFTRLREWVLEKDWAEWDAQIERDSAAGKLDFLLEEVRQAKAVGTLRDL